MSDLYRVEVTKELLVEADDREEARRVATQNVDRECSRATARARKVHGPDDLPDPCSRSVVPWGSDGETTVRDLLEDADE